MKPEELRDKIGATVRLQFTLPAYRDRVVTMFGKLSLVDGPESDMSEFDHPYKYQVGVLGANTYWLRENIEIECTVYRSRHD